jgi:DNA repair protein RadC
VFVGHLDGKHRVALEQTISEGSLTASLAHPREAFVPALQVSAGRNLSPQSSQRGRDAGREDRELTSRLAACGRLLGIPVLDHLVIGAERYFSFADHRLLDETP